jgi:hypothetical protein
LYGEVFLMFFEKTWAILGVAPLAACILVSTSAARSEETAIRVYDASMPRDQQIQLALSAAPDAVAAGASVYILGPKGYERAREGTNGFSCMVQRSYTKSGETTVAPMCFDAQGSRTTMLVYLRKEEMRDAGDSEAQIQAAIDKGYADGTFKAPTQPGIIYMMSCENRLGPDPRTGRPASFPPHIMFYAPYMTAKDLGYGDDPAVPFLVMAGTPQAMMVVIPGAPQQRKCPSND